MKIIIYSSTTCPHCTIIKEFLNELGLDYEVRDISNKVYRKELMEMGFMSIPVTVIDGKAIHGSDLREIGENLIMEDD